MADSAKPATHETANNPTEGCIMVSPQLGEERKNFPDVRSAEHQLEGNPWVPTDLVTDPEKESELMIKMQLAIEKLEKSDFFRVFMEKIYAPEILERFRKVLGSEQKMPMVIYGIGRISEDREAPRLQLSLALLMKRNLSWIGGIEVFDPIISLTESRVLENLGCFVLSVDEKGRRQALKPILFYMPYCDSQLYENLIKANWSADMLSRIALLGNGFEVYRQTWLRFKNPKILEARKHIFATRKFTKELEIQTVSYDDFRDFEALRWHFFSVDANEDLQFTEA